MDNIDDVDGWCVECGDVFHLDDCGGDNPPCPCGCGLCRSCCAAEALGENDDWDEVPTPTPTKEGA